MSQIDLDSMTSFFEEKNGHFGYSYFTWILCIHLWIELILQQMHDLTVQYPFLQFQGEGLDLSNIENFLKEYINPISFSLLVFIKYVN